MTQKKSIKWKVTVCNMPADEASENPGEAEYYTCVLSKKKFLKTFIKEATFVSAIKL